MKQTIAIVAITISMLLATVGPAPAGDPLAPVQAIASKHLLAVAYVDVHAIDVNACLDWVIEQNLLPAEKAQQSKRIAGFVREFLVQATDAGADHVFAVIQQNNLKPSGLPLFVISIAEGKDADQAVKILRPMIGILQQPNLNVELVGDCILCGSAEQIATAKSTPSMERPDLNAAWKKLGGADIGLMVFGSQDTRRAIRELLPALDSPFNKINGPLVADRLVCGGVRMTLPAQLTGKIVIQTSDSDTAATVNAALVDVKQLFTEPGSPANSQVDPIVVDVLNSLKPTTIGNDVVVDLQSVLYDRALISRLIAPL